ncbi:hypothetical protein [Aquimarina sp. LLG6339-5]|uniref:hypothetical protein n=1 Tax=Aquimarina sp. LLG6339-5 TaxID=3160830 RepID=UPI003868424B
MIHLFGIAQCDAIINWKYDGEITLYEKPDGKKIISLKNDQKNENFLSLKIVEETDNFFNVNISLEMSSKSYKGWIKKDKYIGAIVKQEQELMNLTLYTKPNLKDSNKTELEKWKSEFITIVKCEGNWTLVSFDYKGKRIMGWIESDKLCANNYSTCS